MAHEPVKGRCPGCGHLGGLVLSEHGHVLCSQDDCTDPGAAGELLSRRPLRIDDPAEEVRKWVRWLAPRAKAHDYDPHVIGEHLVNAGIAVPHWDYESVGEPTSAGEPTSVGEPIVELSDVNPGDVVRIDFETWGIWGEVFSKGAYADGLILRRREDDEEADDWVLCTGATIRMRQRAASEVIPDPALVEGIRSALVDFAGEEMVITSGDLPYRLAKRLTTQLEEKARER